MLTLNEISDCVRRTGNCYFASFRRKCIIKDAHADGLPIEIQNIILKTQTVSAGLVLRRGLGFTCGVLHHVAVLGSIFANSAFVKSMRALISSL